MQKQEPLHIAVFGAGLVGCYLGGLLAHGGCAVTFIGRKNTLWEIETKGLTLTHFKKKQIYIPAEYIAVATGPDGVRKADIVLVCVKSQDTISAAQSLQPYTRNDAILISMQNGIGHADRLASYMPQNTTLGAVVPYNITRDGTSSVYHCGTDGDLIIEYQNHPRFQAMVKAFKTAGQHVKMERNIEHVQWGKLLINLNNALNALWGGTLRSGLMQRNYRQGLAAMIEEAYLITQRAGQEIKTFNSVSIEKTIKTLRLPNLLYGPIMNNLLKIDEMARSSMLEDLENGRPSEADFLQGEVIRLAKMTRQQAPINTAVLKRINMAFAKGQSPKMSGTALWEMVKSVQPN